MKKLLHETPGKAALDCGATRCVAGVDALDDLQTELLKEGTSIRINAEERHRVLFGDNKTLTTTGTVYVPWRHGGFDVEIAIGVLPDSPMPILLSKNVLKDMKMITDFGRNQVTTPQLREEGQHLKVRESCTGHMLMPMTKKTWNADIKTELTDIVCVEVPDDEKMEWRSVNLSQLDYKIGDLASRWLPSDNRSGTRTSKSGGPTATNKLQMDSPRCLRDQD